MREKEFKYNNQDYSNIISIERNDRDKLFIKLPQYLGSHFKDKNGQKLYEGCKFRYTKPQMNTFVAEIIWFKETACFGYIVVESNIKTLVGVKEMFAIFCFEEYLKDFLNHIEIIK
jgi:hypothetical protein